MFFSHLVVFPAVRPDYVERLGRVPGGPDGPGWKLQREVRDSAGGPHLLHHRLRVGPAVRLQSQEGGQGGQQAVQVIEGVEEDSICR